MAETLDHQNNRSETSQAKTILLQEYMSWSDENNNLFKLVSDCVCDDGRISLVFSVGQEGDCFTLYCPPSYPHYSDNFFVEGSSSFQIWLNCLNEFILDSEMTLSLTAILNKAAATHSTNRRMSVCSSSSGSDTDFCYSSDKDNEDDDFEMSIFLKRKRWRQKEAQLRAANKMPKTSDMFNGTLKDHPNQVFSNSAATGILTNDLVAIMESQKTTGINAEPVDDNIYLWSVFLSDFSNNSELRQDLEQLKSQFGYDYIELELKFTMDLYPFYPPIVRVVRPRLLGSMMLRVACMDHLMLSHWNPARSMLSVLQEIKEFLSQWARLDVPSQRNSISMCPFGAYTSIENHLLWLAFVTEIPSRTNVYLSYEKQPSNTQFPNVDSSQQKAVGKNSKWNAQQFFPSGTGYSSCCQPGWDINSYVAAQQEKDKQIVNVLQKILLELKNIRLKINSSVQEQGNTYSSFQISADTPEEEKMQVEEATPGNCGDCGMTDNAALVEPLLFEILEQSALIPFLETKLQVDTFLEMCQHIPVYQCVMDIIKEFALQPSLVRLLWTLPDQVQSLYTLVTKLQKKVCFILEKVNKSSANGNASHSDDSQINVSEEESLVKDVQEMSNVVSIALENSDFFKAETCNNGELLPPIQPSDPGKSFKDKYMKALKDMQVLSCDIEVVGARSHSFSDEFVKSLAPNASQVMRIAQEVAALSTSLPLDVESSIFVRTDDSKCTLLRALIIGPEGTPYSGGCFQFDIMFPFTYPSAPPLVRFYTKAYGLFRFNPNLYSCGNVCLSLLGTWPGPKSEQWNKDTSTLLQVLISIQSLIFVAEPYFNEPGYERRIGTSIGASMSQNYNENVLLKTVQYAMVEQLRCPSSGFEDVVHTHFALKKDRILEELGNHQKRKFSNNLKVQIEAFKKELKKLPEL
ncbi:baculoviral IAP repeat-containing protein 6-like [Bacillus rossius redtenbacheri]|uniref:baculoviral IAP repeat-containing protein 6-like n=1 Tax=Bacillus rossius redtenbacheri TaxID=93214 RepID=UPI002FDE0AA7